MCSSKLSPRESFGNTAGINTGTVYQNVNSKFQHNEIDI